MSALTIHTFKNKSLASDHSSNPTPDSCQVVTKGERSRHQQPHGLEQLRLQTQQFIPREHT